MSIPNWKDRLNWEPDHTYLLSFVGMAVANPEYEEYVGGGGRLEIDKLGEEGNEEYAYTDLEISYLTKKREELNEFREKWDLEEVTGEKLEEIIEIVQEKFHDGYEEQE